MDGFTRKLYNDIKSLKARIFRLEVGGASDGFISDTSIDEDQYKGELLFAGTASHSEVTKGALVYLDDNEAWRRTCAGSTTFGASNLVGIAISGEPHVEGVLAQGNYRLSSDYISGSEGIFTIGSQVYMHPNTSGSMTTTIPSGSGHIVRVVGQAVKSDMVYFNPSPDYIEI
jgi:hypothetical protein